MPRAPDKQSSNRPATQRRGAELRQHILYTAKDVFLEAGYERASMDAVAARASTSKRSLYAFFENKDKLFVAVLDFVRELYIGTLKTPAHYGSDEREAVALFCGRFLQLIVWEPNVRTCRLIIADSERLPEEAIAYFDTIFTSTQRPLADFLTERRSIDEDAAQTLAAELLSRVALPRLFRTMFNVELPIRSANPPAVGRLARDVDLATIRRLVASNLEQTSETR